MSAPKTAEVPAYQVKAGNIARFKAGAKLPDYLTVTSVTPIREVDGTVKVEIKGTGYGTKWTDSDQEFSMVVLGDHIVNVRLKRTRMVYLKTGEELEFVRRPRIRAANWLRAKDTNGRVRTVFLDEVMRKSWEYRPIV